MHIAAPVFLLKLRAVLTECMYMMIYRVLDKNGNELLRTGTEKIARRLVSDNPERSYILVRSVDRA